MKKRQTERTRDNRSVIRPNEGHLTFTVLFDPDNIPLRTAVSLVNLQHGPRFDLAVSSNLNVIFRSLPQTQSHIVLFFRFTFEAQSTSFGLETTNLSANVLVRSLFALSKNECTAMTAWFPFPNLNIFPLIVVSWEWRCIWRLWWRTFLDNSLAFFNRPG